VRGTVRPVSAGIVLVIEDDEWVAQLLAAAIGDAGFEVWVEPTAAGGIARALRSQPDCIVCDAALPDQSGHHVVRTVRTQPAAVSVTPFVFLSEHDDEASRLEGFQVGADVYMTKPFRVDEVVAQVVALVHMAARLRKRHEVLLSPPPSPVRDGERVLEGDLGQISIASILTVLELERRTGLFEVSSKKRRAALELRGGAVVRGVFGGVATSPIEVLRVLLGWNVGRFAFTVSKAPPSSEVAPSSMKVANMLLEAARLEDEAAPRSRPSLAPSADQVVLGGRASSEQDLAPPSSRSFLGLFSEPPSSSPPSSGRVRR
jgi:two-component system OmpR family response regulator